MQQFILNSEVQLGHKEDNPKMTGKSGFKTPGFAFH